MCSSGSHLALGDALLLRSVDVIFIFVVAIIFLSIISISIPLLDEVRFPGEKTRGQTLVS